MVVGLSAVLSHIPDPAYTWSRHAEWFGLHLLDFILPAFLCLFGAGIAVAYRHGLRWGRLARRTVLLILTGFGFNAVVAWDAAAATWRFTGVLQLFAVTGLVVTLVTRLARAWWQALIVAFVLLACQQVWLSAVADGCASGLPQPGCTPSATIDPVVFGEDHLYRQFDAGYDPEGLAVLPGVSATVLLGYVAGEVLWRYRRSGAAWRLPLLAVGLFGLVPLSSEAMAFNKRIWTPSYALVTAAATVALLAALHVVVDRWPRRSPGLAPLIRRASWLPEAFGRNSLLVYFGKYLVASVLAHVAIGPLTGDTPVAQALLDVLADATTRPALVYAAIMFLAWAVVAAALHRRRRYVKV